MAHGDYYNPDNKVVVAGNIVYADDLNSINSAVDAGFAQVAADLDALESAEVIVEAQAWATEDQGVRPDPLIADYSSKAYATEAKEYATNGQGVAVHKADGTTQVVDSALVSATKAAASAVSASTSADTATTQAGIATTKASLAATSEVNALTYAGNASDSADAAAASASVFTAANILTSIKTVDGSGSGLDADLLDGQQGSYYASQSTVDLKAPIASPTFTGTVSGVTKTMVGLSNVDNTSDVNKPISTAQQTALNLKANLASPTFTGTVVLPSTTSVGSVSNTEIGYLDGVTGGVQSQLNAKAPIASPTFTGVVTTPNLTFSDGTSQISAAYTGGRNKVINGAMLVDQRNAGAAQTITAGAALAYTVDRFFAYGTGANVTGQQVAGPIANTKRYRFTGAASNTGVNFGTRIEGVNTAMMSGKTASLSVKLSSSSLTSITWTAYYANTLDTFGSVASPTKTQIATGTFTINATEATYEAQISISSAATTGIEIVLTGNALLAGQTLTIGDVQLEIGEATTEFEGVAYQLELRRCEWYFRKRFLGVFISQPNTYNFTTLDVQMRVLPTYSTVNIAATNLAVAVINLNASFGLIMSIQSNSSGNGDWSVIVSLNAEM